MKLEYFSIQLRLNYMLKLPPAERLTYFEKLKPRLKKNFIRVEIFHQIGYYEEIISFWQEKIEEYVNRGEYSAAADARPHTIFYKKQLYLSELYFNFEPPPSLHITNSGLIRVRLHSENDKETIMLFRNF